MAKLLSEDSQVKTYIEIMFLKDKLENKAAFSWIAYKLVLNSADRELVFETEKTNKGAGDYVLSLRPVNEIENLINGIKSFLTDTNKELYSFEGLEPSFEFVFERSHKGYSATCWVDAGNVISDHYTWDGFGLRFFTTEKNIKSFVNELGKEGEDLFT
ncbi:MAG: hypothetical protein A3B68_08050 [Candidatus Melainabacteria bacterium RIFCSPHIGHO2_02_FULL_34_12]|nr:MAG: hypothetical protein A3B68_08050 [Candidatus Melainabacteria bacterium RIFCSPHIGHO2_02_FULL_34_12]